MVVQDLANPEAPLPEEAKVGDEAEEEAEAPMTVCSVDPSVFDIPQGYGLYQTGEVRYGEDELLQLAIQQSLMESGSEDQVGACGFCAHFVAS